MTGRTSSYEPVPFLADVDLRPLSLADSRGLEPTGLGLERGQGGLEVAVARHWWFHKTVIDRWSEDLKQGLEREIKDLDKQIREAHKTAALAQSLRDKLEAQKAIKALEKTRNTRRRELFDAQDAIDAQREELIANIEKQLKQRRSVRTLFAIRWTLT